MSDLRNDNLTIVVAGAAGFVGHNLVRRMASVGLSVRGIVHRSAPPEEVPGVDYTEADLRVPEQARTAMRGGDVFVMAAARSSGAAVMRDSPLAHLSPNLVLNATTASIAEELEFRRYVFISSSTVYPPGPKAMAEGDVTGEFFPAYAVVAGMKLYSEQLIQQHALFGRSRFHSVIVRPSNLYGPFDKFSPGEAKVIPALITRALARETPFVVWGDGRDIKDFLYIDDFVRALASLSLEENSPGIVNIAAGKSVSLQAVIPEILAATGFENAELSFDSSKPSMIPERRIDNSLVSSVIDWSPAISLREGLERTVAWYLNQQMIRKASP